MATANSWNGADDPFKAEAQMAQEDRIQTAVNQAIIMKSLSDLTVWSAKHEQEDDARFQKVLDRLESVENKLAKAAAVITICIPLASMLLEKFLK